MSWFERSFRRNLVDVHIDDWDESYLSKLDPVEYVEMLRLARVQSAMVYANSHVGYCLWPATVGRMHRGLRGRDVFGEIVAGCHAAGIDVVGYYSLLYNNWAYDEHPEWRQADASGKASRELPGQLGRYGVCCPNSAGYRAFAETQIRDLLGRYALEGVFFDMTFWHTVCVCAACRQRLAAEVGGEIPTTVDWGDARWLAFQRRREAWLVEFAGWATGVARAARPGISVEHNSSMLVLPWRLGTTIGLAAANDYLGGDLYGGFAEQSFVCKLYHATTPHRPFEFMTSRCDPDLRDHTSIKSDAALALHAGLALAHGGAFLFIDAIDPIGTLDRRVYEAMGRVFEQSSRYEPWVGGHVAADVAVYFSLDAKFDPADSGKPVAAAFGGMPHRAAAMGAAKALRARHVPFGVISRPNLADLSRHRVLVLPEVLVLDDEEAAAIRRFVADGGGLYVSGRTPLDGLADVVPVAVSGETSESRSYLAPTPAGSELLGAIDPAHPLGVSARQRIATLRGPGDVLATIVLPATDPADGTRFASIHSNPPGRATAHPALVRGRFGRGRVVWAAAPLEASERAAHQELFARLLGWLADGPFSLETDAPPALEAVTLEQPDARRRVVSLINAQDPLPPVPVHDVVLRVRGGPAPGRAYLLPERTPLALEPTPDGACELRVPRVELFAMIALEAS
jgi:hypothetical protein